MQLKDYRDKAGISQLELSEQAGVSQQAISNYEAGKNQPSLKVALRIAEALRKRKVKVSISDLVPPSN